MHLCEVLGVHEESCEPGNIAIVWQAEGKVSLQVEKADPQGS